LTSSGGSVAHLLQKYGAFELGAVRNYTRQILHGLVYLHENGIVHRDIKGANVLVTDTGRVPVVKLADFGASTKIVMDQTQDTATIKGTPYFMAPEVMATSKYGRKGDIWAVGCTMIQMLTGSPPWKEFNIQNLVQLHLLLTGWTKGPPPYNRDITVEAQECLNLCFGKEPDQRPTAAQLLRCAFLVGGDELDESAGSFVEDHHEESADLSRLKQQMSRASLAAPELRPRIATGTSTGTGTAGGGGGGAAATAEDTLADIERRMKEQA
jgi:serine/threonine protein kinase